MALVGCGRRLVLVALTCDTPHMLRSALVLTFVCVLAVPAVATARPAADPPPGLQAAIDACKAKGVAGGTPAFNQCVQGQLNAGQPSQPSLPPSAQACQAQGLKIGTDAFNACVKAADAKNGQKPSQPGTDAQKAAVAACKAKGLVDNTPDFQDCLKDLTAVTGPMNAQAKAVDAGCAASGAKRGTDAFRACIAAATQAAAIAGFTGEQMAAYNVCKAQGLAMASNAFAQCLSKMLTKVIPDKGKAATGELDKVVAACNAKHPKTAAALQQCVRDGLGS